MKNGILYKTRTYLVGQMEYYDGQPWRQYIEKEFLDMGIIVFNPYNHPFVNSTKEDTNCTEVFKKLIEKGDYDLVADKMKKIRAEDLRCVDICDFIFCYINPIYPTCGSWEELFWANRMKKPIFLVIEGGKQNAPLWLYGTIPHKYIYDSIDEALYFIKDINSGIIKIDSERWRLLRPEFR